jgi:hypothetical protein
VAGVDEVESMRAAGSQKQPLDEVKRLSLITEAVRYCQRVAEMGMPVSCYSKALREPIFFLWEKRSGPKAKAARFRSRAAVGLMHGRGELVYDHAIPFALLQEELLALHPVTEECVVKVLSRYGTAVLITQADNARLNAMGLARSMPPDWDGRDPLARYKAAGIDLVSNG